MANSLNKKIDTDLIEFDNWLLDKRTKMPVKRRLIQASIILPRSVRAVVYFVFSNFSSRSQDLSDNK